MRSRAETFSAGLSITVPLTETRPSAIIRSASRREATPARDRTLAMRSPSPLASAGGRASTAVPGRGPLGARGMAAGVAGGRGLREGERPEGAEGVFLLMAVP